MKYLGSTRSLGYSWFVRGISIIPLCLLFWSLCVRFYIVASNSGSDYEQTLFYFKLCIVFNKHLEKVSKSKHNSTSFFYFSSPSNGIRALGLLLLHLTMSQKRLWEKYCFHLLIKMLWLMITTLLFPPLRNNSTRPPSFNGDATHFSVWKSKMYSHIICVDDYLWEKYLWLLMETSLSEESEGDKNTKMGLDYVIFFKISKCLITG